MSDRGGSRAAGSLWARHEIRRRWASLVLLSLLAGLAGAVSLSSVAGARRTATAYDRFDEATRGADAIVFASQADIYAPDWTPVAELPYVESAGSFGIALGARVVDGPDDADLATMGFFTVASGDWRTGVDRPIVTAGRLPDQDDPTEVLALPDSPEVGIDVGDELVIAVPSPEQVEAVDIFGEPEGERVTVTVVGLGRSTFDMAAIPGNSNGFVATRAFDEQYGSPTTYIDNLVVRFKPGQGSVAQLEADAREIFDSPSLPVLDSEAASKRVTNGTDLETSGLLLFGAAVAIAGAVLVGQALSRSVRAGAVDVPTLRSLGLTRRELTWSLALPHVPTVVASVALAVGGALTLSPRFPIGLGRILDPDLGLHLDPLVLIGGGGLMALVLLGATVTSAHRAGAPPAAAPRPRRSRLVARVAAWGARPPMVLGASMALEPGRDRRALPTRPALVGVAVGVIGVIGAQTLLAGMNDAIGDPARFGSTWDVETFVESTDDLSGWREAMDRVDADPNVEASAEVGRAIVVVDGVTQPTYAIRPRTGDIDFALLDGRRPADESEVALGPDTADSYDVGIGDTVVALGPGGAETDLEVVGIVLLPTTPHSSYDQGAWVTFTGLEALVGAALGERPEGAAPDSTPPIAPAHLSRLVPEADAEAVAEDLNAALVDTGTIAEVSGGPIDIVNLRNVRSLPLLFALFTAILAVGTVAHVCLSTVRRRGTDLAVLRALGMTRNGVRGVLAWQATTLSVIGLLVGLPVGVALGRTLWRVVAELTPMIFVPPLALAAVVVAVPVTVLAANALALVPARIASRARPAEMLRTE